MKTNTQSQTVAQGQNVREATDLKRSLATVVSVLRNHASARESADLGVLWAHYERVTAQRDELLALVVAAREGEVDARWLQRAIAAIANVEGSK